MFKPIVCDWHKFSKQFNIPLFRIILVSRRGFFFLSFFNSVSSVCYGCFVVVYKCYQTDTQLSLWMHSSFHYIIYIHFITLNSKNMSLACFLTPCSRIDWIFVLVQRALMFCVRSVGPFFIYVLVRLLILL